MSARFVDVDRNTPMLLPPDLRDWVERDDLVHFLVDALEVLDLSAARINHRGTGSEQYPPGMMLALLIYCYANGIFSSRQIEKATYQNVSVRYLAANRHPDHDTIASFRRQNSTLLRSAFVQLLQLARRAGMLQVGVLALDGTKLQANASKRKTLTAAQIEQELSHLDQRISQLLESAEKADQNDTDSTELPVELTDAQARRARLMEAKAQLDQQVHRRHRQRQEEYERRPPGDRPRRVPAEPRPTDTINPTDPDSRLTPSAQARCIQGYNAQLVVSAQHRGLIVAADVVPDANDIQQLEPMIEQAVENVGPVSHVLVDTGYENVRQIVALEKRHRLEVLCPPAATANAKEQEVGRSPWRRQRKAKRQQLRDRLQTGVGRTLYRLRRTTVEPAIGIIKSTLGFVRFGLRGLNHVKTEWLLVSLAFNCRRMAPVLG